MFDLERGFVDQLLAKYDELKPPGLPNAFARCGIDPARRRESNADCCAADGLEPRPEGWAGEAKLDSICDAGGEGWADFDMVGAPRLPRFWEAGKREGTVPARLRRIGADC